MNWLLYMVLFLFLLVPSTGQGQTETLKSFGPELGRGKPSFQYQYTPYSEGEVEGQNKDFQSAFHAAILSIPVFQDSDHEWTLLGTARVQEIQTSALLPDTGESFPESLSDIRLGTQYRHRFTNDWIGGAFLTIGSASDKPFKSETEVSIQATFFTRIPAGGRNAWLFFLNYSRYREFLPNVPIPGIAYGYEPSPEIRLIVGIPFAHLEWRGVRDLTVELTYFAVRNVRAQVSYRIAPSFQVHGGFDWKNEHYFRYDRKEDDKRLSYYEKRLSAGIRWSFYRGLFMDLSGGYAFDRFYFEGESYDDRNENRLNITNGLFGILRLGVTVL